MEFLTDEKFIKRYSMSHIMAYTQVFNNTIQIINKYIANASFQKDTIHDTLLNNV